MKDSLCFVDTVCWIALLNRLDNLHESADQQYKKLMMSGTCFVTTSSVLTETKKCAKRSCVQTVSY